MTSKKPVAVETQRRIEELFYDLNMDFPIQGEMQEPGPANSMGCFTYQDQPDTAGSQPTSITWDSLRQSLQYSGRAPAETSSPFTEYPGSDASSPSGFDNLRMQKNAGDEAIPITPAELLEIVADDPQRHWGDDELLLVEQVSDQLNQAMENARLFSETQHARDALQVSVRYQKSISEAMAILNERGFSAISEVLQILGEASQSQRVCFFETQQDQQGPYWRIVSEWRAAGFSAQIAKPALRHLNTTVVQSWLESVENEGPRPQVIDLKSDQGQELLDLLEAQSILQLPIVFERELPGWLGFVQVDSERTWTPDEVAALQTAASAVTNTILRENLFNQLQFNFSETEAQYQASAQLNSANDAPEILTIMRQFTILGHMNVSFISISLFDAPWALARRPEWLIQTAQWMPDNGASPFGERFDLRDWKNLNHLFTQDHPTILFDIAGEPRLDAGLRKVFLEKIGAKSMLAVPLNVSGRWIGLIIAFYNQITGFSERDIRRLVSLSQQAAIAVQSLRLLDESRRRAGHLQTAAEIARDTTGTLAIEELFQRTVNLIKERFGYYHASIFLVDETTQQAVVRESTGPAGEAMKQARHSLPVGGQSIIGRATGTGKPIVLNDVNEEQARKTHRPNPLLPYTQAELGIPLIIGDRVIGALDVQSDEANSFTEDDIAVLQTLSDQIAIAVVNAQSYALAQKAVEEIREMDRLKTQFLANMSHELRTPLNSIIGFSRIILKGIDGPINSQQVQDLTAIYNSGQHLLGLINDVLDQSRIEAGKMDMAFEETNLGEIIHGVMSTTVGLVKDKPIELKQVLDPELPLVTADATKIRQVLINFLSNSAKFTERGSITIQAMRKEGKDGELQVIVRVIDTGPGIALQDQVKLFQPFSQVDGSLTRKTGGSGLGLSISRRLIEMHHGEIGLESEPGKGSIFYFVIPVKQPLEANQTLPDTLPVEKASPEAKTNPAPKKPEQASKVEEQTTVDHLPSVLKHGDVDLQPAETPKLILAIDSDHQVIDLYRRYLAGSGYSVIAINHLDQAVEAARGLQPGIITLDLAMKDPETRPATGDLVSIKIEDTKPALNGLMVLEKLKKDPITRQIPIIICSMLTLQDKAFEIGVAEYLLKPILEEDLVQAIQRVQAKDKR